MSATIPENMLLSDLLKATGYDCPDSLKDKTFDESTSGGSEVVLEDNKEATIDVSSYTAPVEITPSEGKDAMKKATVTLSNIPSGGVSTLYAFAITNDEYVYYSTTLDLKAGDKLLVIAITGYDPANYITVASYDSSTKTVTDEYGVTYQYDSTKDIPLV